MALTEGKQIHFIGLSPNDYGRLCEYWKEVDPVAAKKTLEIYRQRLLVVSSWFSEVTILESAPSEYGLWRREEEAKRKKSMEMSWPFALPYEGRVISGDGSIRSDSHIIPYVGEILAYTVCGARAYGYTVPPQLYPNFLAETCPACRSAIEEKVAVFNKAQRPSGE